MRNPQACGAVLGASLTLLLGWGCHDQKAASKENFGRTLTAFFAKACMLLSPAPLGEDNFPAQVWEHSGFEYYGPRYEALVDAKLLTQVRSVSKANMFDPSIRETKFALTDRGGRLFMPPGSVWPGSPGGFCAGHIELVSVDQFTKPVVQSGQRGSQVTFTEKLSEDDWARLPAVQAAYHVELSQTAPVQHTVPMVLTNDGWAIGVNLPASDYPGLK